MGWINPVPNGIRSRGFGPTVSEYDGPMFADAALRRAHDPGNGAFGNFWPHFHAAIDAAAVLGTPIYAPEAATVLDAKWGVEGTWANGGGWFIRARVNANCQYLLAHCSQLYVAAGQRIAKGQLIARIGSTGVATGNHTHFWVRLGPAPYYDPDAYYWDPALVLPGGALHGDGRFAPGGLPDTSTAPPGTANLTVDGDPAPMKFHSLIDKGDVPQVHVRAYKPIRAGARVTDRTITTTDSDGRNLRAIGNIKVERLPSGEQPFGDVYVCVLYDTNGSRLGYVKAVDIR